MWPSAASVAASPAAAAAAPALGGVTVAARTAAVPCARPAPAPTAALGKAPPLGAKGVWAGATAAAAATALAVAAASSANRRGPATPIAPNVLAGGFWLLPVPSPLSTPSTPSTAAIAPAPNPGSKPWRMGKGLKRLIGVSVPNRAAGALSTAADPEPDLRTASPEPSLRVTEGAVSSPRPCHWRLLAVTVAPPTDAASGELLLEVAAVPPAAAVAMPPRRLRTGAGVKLGPG